MNVGAGRTLFHVVLLEPEIPNNTGNIGRTCVALGAALHLIHPLGFDVSEKACRRAGLDYWGRLDVREHSSWAEYRRYSGGSRRWALTAKAARPVFDARFEPGDHFVFGRESEGLPSPVLRAHRGRLLSLPMAPGERSLNLATAVCAVLYEGVRQLLSRAVLELDPQGRLRDPGMSGALRPARRPIRGKAVD